MTTSGTNTEQVSARYAADRNGGHYHRRCLVVSGPDGKWIGISPDHEVMAVVVVALSEGLVLLKRNARFPAHVPGNEFYAFDPFLFGIF